MHTTALSARFAEAEPSSEPRVSIGAGVRCDAGVEVDR